MKSNEHEPKSDNKNEQPQISVELASKCNLILNFIDFLVIKFKRDFML